jgi:hypothetical protein
MVGCVGDQLDYSCMLILLAALHYKDAVMYYKYLHVLIGTVFIRSSSISWHLLIGVPGRSLRGKIIQLAFVNLLYYMSVIWYL